MENVTVRMTSRRSTALSWEHDGARFHIWEPTPDVLYKNPPEGTVYKGEGYFPTRKLRPLREGQRRHDEDGGACNRIG